MNELELDLLEPCSLDGVAGHLGRDRVRVRVRARARVRIRAG